MSDKKENKIDAVIDTVLESKRLKQGAIKTKKILFSIFKGLTFITPFLTAFYSIQQSYDAGIYIGAGVLWMLAFGILMYLLRPQS
ncbi:hypothetical protein SAMN05216262_105169 [Colwellia chukchiensis]|uniref:Uncharacterized protein n=1 Tax=Colwellia chukchiensis TaxID=641665 RepID=A0A1H7MB46_9GAMM|nr:hypothetical protein [Colwellia chukchiensis]SEL08413.1 hypothetical protein SAMN05216262_105169 [Colwellia chukchiensis]